MLFLLRGAFAWPRRLAFASLLAVATILLLFPGVRDWLYENYAHRRLEVDAFFDQSWKKLPLESGYYQGTLDLSGRERKSIEDGICNSDQYLQQFLKQDASSEVVSCNEHGGAKLPLCAFDDIPAFDTPLRAFPAPSLGIDDLLGARGCATSESRWQWYDVSNASDTRTRSDAFSWERVDIGKIQTDCLSRNQHRFNISSRFPADQPRPEEATTTTKGHEDLRYVHPKSARASSPRTAVVLRAWDDLKWTSDDVRNVRAMVTELSLFSGGEYEVFILLHMRNASQAVPQPGETLADVKRRFVPSELVGITEMWNYTDCETAYPNVGEYDVYDNTFMPLQLLAQRHPEFDYYWNWEMDVRYTGHYYDLMTRIRQWARNQHEHELWDLNARFYIPSYHGSYSHFEDSISTAVEQQQISRSRTETLRHRTSQAGAEADLITLFPMFDVVGTLWPYRNHLVNYDSQDLQKPRRAAVNTDMRLSSRLLALMDRENRERGRSMFSEMWPPTLALQHGLKAVYVPHPVYLERRWPVDMLRRKFNAGPGEQVGGSLDTVINHEDPFYGSTWFYRSDFTLRLYKAWLGDVDQAANGPGSKTWATKHGEICLPPMLLHPVKSRDLR